MSRHCTQRIPNMRDPILNTYANVLVVYVCVSENAIDRIGFGDRWSCRRGIVEKDKLKPF